MLEPRVVAQRDGRGLVRDEGRLYVVPAAIVRELTTAEGRARWRARAGASRRRHGARRSFWVRIVILPERIADRCAAPLARLASSWGLVLMASGGLVAAAVVAATGAAPPWPATAADRAAGLGLFLLTALWHELGHAAALRRECVPAGEIGAGMLWVLPVLFCDVSAAALLPRSGRLRVDAAGTAFQLAAAGLLSLGAAGCVSPAMSLASAGALLAVLWNATPVLRADGYWFLLDLASLDALETPLAAGSRRRLALVSAWRVASAAALVALAVGMPWRLARIAATLGPTGWPPPAVVALQVVIAGALAVGSWGALARAGALGRVALADLRRGHVCLASGRGAAILSGECEPREAP